MDVKEIAAGSHREILPAVWVYRTEEVSKDRGWMGRMKGGLEES